MAAKAKPKKHLVAVAELAELLDLDVRRVQQLAKEGVIEKAGRGRYDPKVCVPSYVGWIRDKMPDRDQVVTMEEIRRRKQVADTELAELALEEARGLVVEREIVVETVGEDYTRIRSKLLAMRGRYATRFARIKTAPKMREAIGKAVGEVLGELSDPDEIAEHASAQGSGKGTRAAGAKKSLVRRGGESPRSAS